MSQARRNGGTIRITAAATNVAGASSQPRAAAVRRRRTAPRVRHWADLDLGDGRLLRMGVSPGQRADAGVAVLNFTTIENLGVSRVQREVKNKSTKYAGLKDAGFPFVVAFFAQSALADEESLFDALYGQQTINVWLDEEE